MANETFLRCIFWWCAFPGKTISDKNMINLNHKKSRLPEHIQVAILALAACVFFAGLSAIVKHLSGELHGFVIVFWRNLFGFVFMLPWLCRNGFGRLKTGRLGAYLFRSSISVISMMCGFTALGYMPIANATSLSFTAPLFATILAIFLLKEKVRLRRWSATLIGFAGVMVVLQPGAHGGIGLGEMLAIAGAFLTAMGTIIVKTLSRSESSQAIVTYMVLFSTPLALIPASFYWTWPSMGEWPFVVALGLCGTLGHLCWTRAFAIADASAVVPYDYARLMFTTALGMIWFGEMPDHWFWIGSAIIVGAGFYIAQREAALRRSRATQAMATQASADSAQSGIAVDIVKPAPDRKSL